MLLRRLLSSAPSVPVAGEGSGWMSNVVREGTRLWLPWPWLLAAVVVVVPMIPLLTLPLPPPSLSLSLSGPLPKASDCAASRRADWREISWSSWARSAFLGGLCVCVLCIYVMEGSR